jgi:hypothetical protein
VKSDNKTASSQAAWALLTEGVTSARIEGHRIRHLVNRLLAVVNSSSPEDRERLFATFGDVLVALPDRLDQLESVLDKTSYALIKMGDEFMRPRLPLSDRTEVEEAVHAVQPFSSAQSKGSDKPPSAMDNVVNRYLRQKVKNEKPGG